MCFTEAGLDNNVHWFRVWECICKRAVREPGHNEREGKKKVDMCTLDIDMTGKK